MMGKPFSPPTLTHDEVRQAAARRLLNALRARRIPIRLKGERVMVSDIHLLTPEERRTQRRCHRELRALLEVEGDEPEMLPPIVQAPPPAARTSRPWPQLRAMELRRAGVVMRRGVATHALGDDYAARIIAGDVRIEDAIQQHERSRESSWAINQTGRRWTP